MFNVSVEQLSKRFFNDTNASSTNANRLTNERRVGLWEGEAPADPRMLL
jgi:hypothetical protein